MSVVQAIWAECPCVTRLLVLLYPTISLVLALFSGIVPLLQLVFPACSVATVFGRGLFWAVPFGFLYEPVMFGPALLFVLLELYMAAVLFAARERALGSSAFLCWVTLTSAVVSAVFLSITSALSVVLGSIYQVMPIQGLWPSLIVCLTIRSLAKVGETSNLWGVVQIPNKWYPIFLGVLMSLLSGQILWDMVAALCVGYAHRYQTLDCVVLGRSWTAGLESVGCVIAQRMGTSWVPPGGTDWSSVEIGNSTYGLQSGSTNSPSFRVFQGQGQRLGGT